MMPTIRLLAVDLTTGQILTRDGKDSGWVVVPETILPNAERLCGGCREQMPTVCGVHVDAAGNPAAACEATEYASPPIPAELAMEAVAWRFLSWGDKKLMHGPHLYQETEPGDQTKNPVEPLYTTPERKP
jgi:hypothetical protein